MIEVPANHSADIMLPLADGPVVMVRHRFDPKNPPQFVEFRVRVPGRIYVMDASLCLQKITEMHIHVDTTEAVNAGAKMMVVFFQ